MKLRTTALSIPADGIWIDATLAHAPDVRGLVLVLQPGSNPVLHQRQAVVAAALQSAGFATLTLDLVSHAEEVRDVDARFNVSRLADRLLSAAVWIAHQPSLSNLSIGLVAFGTASAAAIRAAARSPRHFGALACVGGRPDLAGAGPLKTLDLPSLFLVGRNDPDVAILRRAYGMLKCTCSWQDVGVLEGEVPGADMLQRCGVLSSDWMLQHLPVAPVEDEADGGLDNLDTLLPQGPQS